jgi:HlyD family secretion protein
VNAASFAIDSAARAVAQANADLALARAGSRPEAIAAHRAQVAVQRASLDVLLADISKRRLVAPIDGIVTEVSVEKGETIQPGAPAVVMNAKGGFEIITNISEIDIARVTIGDAVMITLDAFPRSDTWTGKVAKIDPAEKVVDSVIFYETTIVFDGEDPRLRPGMTANLAIETERREPSRSRRKRSSSSASRTASMPK